MKQNYCDSKKESTQTFLYGNMIWTQTLQEGNHKCFVFYCILVIRVCSIRLIYKMFLFLHVGYTVLFLMLQYHSSWTRLLKNKLPALSKKKNKENLSYLSDSVTLFIY